MTDVFGHVIAKQLEEMWQLTGKTDFTIVEFGAGMGSLCIDILGQLKNNKAFYKKLKYCIIEKSDAMRLKEQEAIHRTSIAEKVHWFNSVEECTLHLQVLLSQMKWSIISRYIRL